MILVVLNCYEEFRDREPDQPSETNYIELYRGHLSVYRLRANDQES